MCTRIVPSSWTLHVLPSNMGRRFLIAQFELLGTSPPIWYLFAFSTDLLLSSTPNTKPRICLLNGKLLLSQFHRHRQQEAEIQHWYRSFGKHVQCRYPESTAGCKCTHPLAHPLYWLTLIWFNHICHRASQIIFPLLSHNDAPHALLVGDFNIDDHSEENQTSLDEPYPEYLDTWPAVNPSDRGLTMSEESRIDRVMLRSQDTVFVPMSLELLGRDPLPGLQDSKRDPVHPSDHFGLRAVFKVRDL